MAFTGINPPGSGEQTNRQIRDYLFQLTEQLRYTLNNLGEENLSGELAERISESGIKNALAGTIEDIDGNVSKLRRTAKELKSEMSDVNGNISTLTQTADSLTTKVENAEGKISTLKQTADRFELTVGAAMDAAKLTFDSTGLTVKGGGIRIKNNAGTEVLSADTAGNLTLRGGFQSLSNSSGYGVKIFNSSIAFYKDNFATWSGQIDVDASYGMRLFGQGDVSLYAKAGNVVLYTEGGSKQVQVKGSLFISDYGGDGDRQSRIVVQNPATVTSAGAGYAARWVYRPDLGGYSLGIVM